MSDDKLTAIKARLAAATPGPWYTIDASDNNERKRGIVYDDEPYGDGGAVCDSADQSDAEFIAHAPADIAYLVGEVERLRNENNLLALKWQGMETHLNEAVAAENARLRDEVNDRVHQDNIIDVQRHLVVERDEARAQLARAVELLGASQEFIEVPWGGSAEDKHKMAVIQFLRTLRTTEGGK